MVGSGSAILQSRNRRLISLPVRPVDVSANTSQIACNFVSSNAWIVAINLHRTVLSTSAAFGPSARSIDFASMSEDVQSSMSVEVIRFGGIRVGNRSLYVVDFTHVVVWIIPCFNLANKFRARHNCAGSVIAKLLVTTSLALLDNSHSSWHSVYSPFLPL